jgi:cell division protein FtsL
MNTRENLAYDLSLFERREREPFKRQTKVKIVPNPKTKQISKITVFKWVAVTVVVVLSIVSIMLCNVKLTELNDKVIKAKSAYNSAKSEQTRFNMQLESRMSLKNVEDYAITKLGLQKVQSYQIEYINLANSDKVEVNNQDRNVFLDFLHNILEYFK